MRRLTCWLRGHRWSKRTHYRWFMPGHGAPAYVCLRCYACDFVRPPLELLAAKWVADLRRAYEAREYPR